MTPPPAATQLAAMTWTDLDAPDGHRSPRRLLALPVGSTEQHGPHLPLGTDTLVAESLARRLGAARDDVVVAPPLPYGSAGEHREFPGTLSIGRAALETLVVELVRSADDFEAVILVSGHGGNAAPLAAAADRLAHEGRFVLPWAPRPALAAGIAAELGSGRPPDAHAGWVETSLILAIAPELVRPDAAKGVTRPLRELAGTLARDGVRAVSPTGVLGDPTGASAEAGRALLAVLGADLLRSVNQRWPRVDNVTWDPPSPDHAHRSYRQPAPAAPTAAAGSMHVPGPMSATP